MLGKYTSPMDPLGRRNAPYLQTFLKPANKKHQTTAPIRAATSPVAHLLSRFSFSQTLSGVLDGWVLVLWVDRLHLISLAVMDHIYMYIYISMQHMHNVS